MNTTDLMLFADQTETAAANVTATETAAAPAADGSAPARPAGMGGGLMSWLPMIVLLVVMFYLMYRGQKKEQKRRQEMLTAIKKGDQIVTIGGIHGEVVEIRDDSFVVKVADGVNMTFSKAAIASTPNSAAQGAAKK